MWPPARIQYVQTTEERVGGYVSSIGSDRFGSWHGWCGGVNDRLYRCIIGARHVR